MHAVFYPRQLRTYLQLTVPQIVRKNKVKAWNMVLNVKAVRSRITYSKQEISSAASKWLKENNFQSCKKSEFESSEIYPFGHVSNIYKWSNNFLFLRTVNRFIQYSKLLLFFESPNTTGDRLCGLVVRVSGYRYRGLGFDSRRYQIFWVERGALSLVSLVGSIEELLE